MSTYDAWIEGRHDLAQINLQIHRQEAAFSKFQSSKVAPDNNTPSNLVTFERLPPEPGEPDLTTIVKDGDAGPSGTQRVWAGVMVVKDSLTAVAAFRAR